MNSNYAKKTLSKTSVRKEKIEWYNFYTSMEDVLRKTKTGILVKLPEQYAIELNELFGLKSSDDPLYIWINLNCVSRVEFTLNNKYSISSNFSYTLINNSSEYEITGKELIDVMKKIDEDYELKK